MTNEQISQISIKVYFFYNKDLIRESAKILCTKELVIRKNKNK